MIVASNMGIKGIPVEKSTPASRQTTATKADIITKAIEEYIIAAPVLKVALTRFFGFVAHIQVVTTGMINPAKAIVYAAVPPIFTVPVLLKMNTNNARTPTQR